MFILIFIFFYLLDCSSGGISRTAIIAIAVAVPCGVIFIIIIFLIVRKFQTKNFDEKQNKNIRDTEMSNYKKEYN